MAKLKGALLSNTASGKVGDKIIFRETRHGQVATRYHYPGSRNPVSFSQAQLDNQALYAAAYAAWSALSGGDRLGYDALGKLENISGWNYFMRDQMLSPHASAIVSGTITGSVDEADIVAGGKVIIITLANDTWIS